MVAEHRTAKYFTNFGGLDLRSPDITRTEDHATVAENVDIRLSGALNKRRGYQARGINEGGFGMTVYANTDVATGEITKELLVVNDALHKAEFETLTVAYSGSNVAQIHVYLHTDNKFYLDLYDNSVRVLNQDLGTGINEASPYTLSSLKTAIDLIADFSATLSGLDTAPAAFLEITELTTISTSITVEYIDITEVPGSSGLFVNTQAAKNNSDFENASFTQLNNILYIATGYDELVKYDGQNAYRAGITQDDVNAVAVSGAYSSTFGEGLNRRNDIRYKVTYEQLDQKGNVVEGDISDDEVVVDAEVYSSNYRVASRVTINGIQASSGFNTGCAIVSGLQAGVNTINVGSGHTFEIGDKAFFLDSTANEITRNITNTAATTITIDGAVVTVADNAVISNNLKVNIYRNEADSSDLYYLVKTVPNDSINSTFVYYDELADAAREGALVISFQDSLCTNLSLDTLRFTGTGVASVNLVEGTDWTATVGNALATATSFASAVTSGVSWLTVESTTQVSPTVVEVTILTNSTGDFNAAWYYFTGSATYGLRGVNNDLTDPVTKDFAGWADSGLISNAQYVAPIKTRDIPPKCKYITSFQNLLILAGDPENPQTTYYSDVDGPEYFPSGDNSFNTATSKGDKVTGIAPLRSSLLVFKDRSIYALTGTLGSDQFRVDLINKSDVGCLAHQTIQEVDGGLFFLTSKGVHVLDSSASEPKHISLLIEPRFSSPDVTFNFTKATAVHWRKNNKYLLFMPVESTSTNDYNNSNSKVFAYDYQRNAWLEWTNMDFGGGIAELDDELYFSERRLGTLSGNVEYYSYKISNNGLASDFADHDSAISFTYKSNWESGEEPSVFKRFLRVNVHAGDSVLNNFESTTFTIDLKTENDLVTTTKTDATLNFSDGSGGRLKSKKTKLWRTKAKQMRIVFENSELKQNLLISGYEIEMAVTFKVEIK